MLTHEELKEKCQELQYAANLLLDTIRENNCVYDSHRNEHKYLMDKLFDRRDSLMKVYINNRDNISDADAEEILITIIEANNIALSYTWYAKHSINSQIARTLLNELKNNAN